MASVSIVIPKWQYRPALAQSDFQYHSSMTPYNPTITWERLTWPTTVFILELISFVVHYIQQKKSLSVLCTVPVKHKWQLIGRANKISCTSFYPSYPVTKQFSNKPTEIKQKALVCGAEVYSLPLLYIVTVGMFAKLLFSVFSSYYVHVLLLY